jgi:hypothetical protein
VTNNNKIQICKQPTYNTHLPKQAMKWKLNWSVCQHIDNHNLHTKFKWCLSESFVSSKWHKCIKSAKPNQGRDRTELRWTIERPNTQPQKWNKKPQNKFPILSLKACLGKIIISKTNVLKMNWLCFKNSFSPNQLTSTITIYCRWSNVIVQMWMKCNWVEGGCLQKIVIFSNFSAIFNLAIW